MLPDLTVFAWTKDDGAGTVTAAFVGEGALARNGRDWPAREPAKRQCASIEDARRWIQQEADAIGVSVTWLKAAPER